VEQLSKHVVESIIYYLHKRYVLSGLKGRTIHRVTYVFLIHIVNKEVSETILRIGLYVTRHVLPERLMSYVLKIGGSTVFIR
jgi:hypothetical protein